MKAGPVIGTIALVPGDVWSELVALIELLSLLFDARAASVVEQLEASSSRTTETFRKLF